MDFPQPPGDNGGDGPGRPPRKFEQNDEQDDEAEQRPIEAFGEATELPVWVFLFLAAILAEHFRSYCVC
ncbi:hypothetical protein BWQ96_05690 [Gracilariopsis chorda]|uniref:Uncharacterized protein n=1 Tax=Gracilariopsis chorda TaxID=448386 RepID=A0A2V3IQX0_9FLOR|nr:hypothetical protein BWQ96_05690 [Gracilariopsis chorda]|eukprot:PXF44512.1 hypothetical protein BWQ96_05690 [Gracilariopsis chorda]